MVLGAKNKLFIFVMSLVVALVTVLVGTFSSTDFNISAVDATQATRDIVITKVWANDDTTVRPAVTSGDLVVHLKKTSATLQTGSNLASSMQSLAGGSKANVESILHATKAQYEAATAAGKITQNVSISGEPVYMWYDSNTIYYYSEADNIYMNANSQGTFGGFTSLTTIDGLSDLNTTYVTNMASMFLGSVKITDLSAISSWDVSNVTSMRRMFDSDLTNSSGPYMSIASFSPLASWDTQKVTDMRMMFKGCADAADVSTLAGWNVSSAADMGQMFMRTNITDATALAVWDVRRVGSTYYNVLAGNRPTGNFTQMFAYAGNPKSNTSAIDNSNMPIFTSRPGSWGSNGNGTYTASGDAASTAPATVTKTPSADNQTCSTWVDNGNNTWTCKVTVSNDNAIYSAWEDSITDYTSSCGLNDCTASDPARGVTSSVSITNTNDLYKEISLTKQWIGDTAYATIMRPTDITARVQKNGSDVKVSDNSEWTKSGSTWTYKFIVFDDSLSGYTVSEDAINHYTNNGTQNVTIDGSTGYGSATITNTLTTYDLTFNKKVTGNLAELDKTFNYSIKVFDINGDQVAALSQSGTWQNGFSNVISGIPEGYTYEISETDTSDYREYYKIVNTDDSTDVIADTTEALSTGTQTINSNQTVTFTNNKEKPPVSGVFNRSSPFSLIVAMLIGGFTSSTSFILIDKLRHKVRDG